MNRAVTRRGVMATARGGSATAQTWRALAADVGFVMVFVLIGRRSHDEAAAAVGLLRTATPFLVGLGVGWVVVRAWRRPWSMWPEGVAVWLATVALGMGLRALSGQGVAVSFVVVTLVVLAVFLLGWRAVFAVVQRRRDRAPAEA